MQNVRSSDDVAPKHLDKRRYGCRRRSNPAGQRRGALSRMVHTNLRLRLRLSKKVQLTGEFCKPCS